MLCLKALRSIDLEMRVLLRGKSNPAGKGGEPLVLGRSVLYLCAVCKEIPCAGASGFILEISWKELGCNHFPVYS